VKQSEETLIAAESANASLAPPPSIDAYPEIADSDSSVQIVIAENDDESNDAVDGDAPIDLKDTADDEAKHESADEMNVNDEEAVGKRSMTMLCEVKAKEIMEDVKELDKAIDQMFAEFDQVNSMWTN
jgi:hypothetical protein